MSVDSQEAELDLDVPQGLPCDIYQVQNSCGAYVYTVDGMRQLARFLCLGSESGTYYVNAGALQKENLTSLQKLIASGHGAAAVDLIRDYSVNGRTAKQDGILFALAACVRSKDPATVRAAYAVLQDVCRIPTHLFAFLTYARELATAGGKGWGRAMKRALCLWYNERPAKQLLRLVTKYKNREGWTHSDVFKLIHIKPASDNHQYIYNYLINEGKKTTGVEEEVPGNVDWDIVAFRRALDGLHLHLKNGSPAPEADTVCERIREFSFEREHIPTEYLKEKKVWQALLGRMGLTALLRNLNTLTRLEVISDGEDEEVEKEAKEALDKVLLRLKTGYRAARIHPFQVLTCWRTYASGHGERGQQSWKPIPRLCAALEQLFYDSFSTVQPTGKRVLVALDVSGSMSTTIMGSQTISAREASTAMAMVTIRTEPWTKCMAFSDTFMALPQIDASTKLEKACSITNALPFSSTDCSLPMSYATEHKLPVDVFIVYTDCETNAAWNIKPHVALRKYREKMNIPDAKLIVVAMTSTAFTIADPNDPNMLDIAGFDTNTPQVMEQFIRGTI
jgi:60 kDa SS-A/Ro ribonucleoprotein